MSLTSTVGLILVLTAILAGLISLFSFVPRRDKYALRVVSVILAIASIPVMGWTKFEQNPVYSLSLLGTYLVWFGALELYQEKVNVKRLVVGTILGLWCGTIALMVVIGWTVMFTPILAGLFAVTIILLPSIREK